MDACKRASTHGNKMEVGDSYRYLYLLYCATCTQLTNLILMHKREKSRSTAAKVTQVEGHAMQANLARTCQDHMWWSTSAGFPRVCPTSHLKKLDLKCSRFPISRINVLVRSQFSWSKKPPQVDHHKPTERAKSICMLQLLHAPAGKLERYPHPAGGTATDTRQPAPAAAARLSSAGAARFVKNERSVSKLVQTLSKLKASFCVSEMPMS